MTVPAPSFLGPVFQSWEFGTHASVNGVRISYTDEGKGLTLLFVHGFPLSRAAWQKQMSALKSSYRVITPDLRGLGESETRVGTNSMSQYAEDLQALILQLKAGPVVMIGHSMGGFVALAFALKFPELLQGLVLVGTTAGNDNLQVSWGRRATAEKVNMDGIKVVVDAMAPKMIFEARQNQDMVDQVRSMMARSKHEGVIGALLGMAERPDLTSRLSEIAVPTLVITGADDVIIPPEESDKLSKGIAGSHLSVIPQAGHLVAFEQPIEFNRVLKEWLNLEHVGAPALVS